MLPAPHRSRQRPRLILIRDSLAARVTEATAQGWLGELEGLRSPSRRSGQLSRWTRGPPPARRDRPGLPPSPAAPPAPRRTARRSPVNSRRHPASARTAPRACAAASTPTRPPSNCSSARHLPGPRRLHQPHHHRQHPVPAARQRTPQSTGPPPPPPTPAPACSGGERRIFRLAASLAAGLPVNLRDTLTGLDEHNLTSRSAPSCTPQATVRPPRTMIISKFREATGPARRARWSAAARRRLKIRPLAVGRGDHHRVAAHRRAPASTLTSRTRPASGRRPGACGPRPPGRAAGPLSYPGTKSGPRTRHPQRPVPAISPDERSGLAGPGRPGPARPAAPVGRLTSAVPLRKRGQRPLPCAQSCRRACW